MGCERISALSPGKPPPSLTLVFSALSWVYFHRGATSLVEGVSCAPQGVRWSQMGWLCPVPGSPWPHKALMQLSRYQNLGHLCPIQLLLHSTLDAKKSFNGIVPCHRKTVSLNWYFLFNLFTFYRIRWDKADGIWVSLLSGRFWNLPVLLPGSLPVSSAALTPGWLTVHCPQALGTSISGSWCCYGFQSPGSGSCRVARARSLHRSIPKACF